jgi:hypothetical protein
LRRISHHRARCAASSSRDDSKRLAIRDIKPTFHGDAFRALFLLPSMRRLQSLTLDLLRPCGYQADSFPLVPPASYSAAFSHLHALRELELSRIIDIDLLLPSVPSAPRLSTLRIRPQGKVESVPSFRCFVRLLTDAPLLQCILLCNSMLHRPSHADDNVARLMIALAKKQRARVTQRMDDSVAIH